MNVLKESIKLFFTKKVIIVFLIMISFMLSTNTFAYWGETVQGTQSTATATFTVGSPKYDNHQFVLDSENNTYSYDIPLDQLLEDYEKNVDEIIFGIAWNDTDIPDELKEMIENGEVEISYELIVTKAGVLATKSKTKRLSKLISIEYDTANPESIPYSSNPTTFNLSISITDENRRNDHRQLGNHDIEVIFTFNITTINYNN